MPVSFRPISLDYQEGEMPGDQSFMGNDPRNDVTLAVWMNLTLSTSTRGEREDAEA